MNALPNVGANLRGPFLALPGGFSHAGTSVPFWAVTLTAEDAVSFIKLPSDIPISAERPIDIDELFQRELDEKRVNGALDQYLKREGKPKFFNSLTVALLPLDERAEGDGVHLADRYALEALAQQHVHQGYVRTDIGQVSVASSPADQSHAFLAWNPARTMPVVLDGQHRLAALKRALVTGPTFPGRADLQNAKVSILVLVLDPRAGFVSGQEQSVLSACRSVFIDLNKHAKQVSRARQYLLDDDDVIAACLRSVLAREVQASPGESVDARAQSGRLPLALVDWRSESAKFDGGSPYITTVLALHAVIDAIVDAKSPASDEYDQVGTYIDRVTSRLLAGEALVEARLRVQTRLGEELATAERRELPFGMPLDAVRELAVGFHSRYALRIIAPLTQFAPYRQLIRTWEDAGYLATNIEPWFSFDDQGRARLIEQLDATDPASDILSTAKSLKEGNLAFQVVFQRALLLACHAMLAYPVEVANALDLESSATEEELVAAFIQRANARLAPALGQGAGVESPFLGAGIRADGSVDFRKTRVGSIVAFFLFAVLMPVNHDESGADAAIRDWLRANWERRNGHDDGRLVRLLGTYGTRWRTSIDEVLRSQGQESVDALDFGVRQLKKLIDG